MADGIVLCYDCSDATTLASIETRWLPEARTHGPGLISNGKVLLLGTKSDLPDADGVAQRAHELALELGCLHGTCSAQQEIGVDSNLARLVTEVKTSPGYLAKLRERQEQELVMVEDDHKPPVRCCPEAEGKGRGRDPGVPARGGVTVGGARSPAA